VLGASESTRVKLVTRVTAVFGTGTHIVTPHSTATHFPIGGHAEGGEITQGASGGK
jgi:predicted neutral ceramidase superfamily lipid hydrolase